MDIDLARTLLEIVASGSFAKAADRLHVAQSTVTMRIKVLETELTQKLLIRNKTGITLTAAGVRFHRHAESLVRTWRLMHREMALQSSIAGILSVGADASLWDELLFDWVCHMRERPSQIAIRCEAGNSERLLNRLFQGWLDICIVYTAQSRVGFSVEPLFEDPLVLVSTEDRSRVDWDPDYVEIDWDESFRIYVENTFVMSKETPKVSVNRGSLGIRCVLKFGGSTWIPERLLRNQSYAQKLFPVRDVVPLPRTAYVVYSKEAIKERLPDFSINEFRSSVLDLVNR